MAHNTPKPDAAAAEAAAAATLRPLAPSSTVKITSEKLFAGTREVQIDHHGALYRLKKTSLGKLILTK